MNEATRRILAEVRELNALANKPDAFFVAAPLETDLFEWHFTVRGPPDTAFAGGLYHGRILLPPEYPLKAPEIMLLTKNGRFELNVPICLSVTAHHQETWQPSWGIRTILTALVGFMPSAAEGLGALDFPDDERRRLAVRSHAFCCERCGARPVEQLPPAKEGQRLGDGAGAKAAEAEAGETTAAVGSSSGAGSAAQHAARATPAEDESVSTEVEAIAPAAGGASADAPGLSQRAPTESAASPPPARTRTRRTARRSRGAAVDERGLLYAAYGIMALILVIFVRNVVRSMA